MPSLSVKDFACIELAELDLARLTVIIGPQSSGKSLLSKLVYFCSELVSNYVDEPSFSIERFRLAVEKRFIEWFPPSAWGKKRFSIIYKAGPIEFEFTRHATNRPLGNKVRFSASEYFTVQYEQASVLLREAYLKVSEPSTADRRAAFDLYYDIRSTEERRFQENLGDQATAYQLYIPAGRSFFLNVEQAYSAARESRALDPITNMFGQYFSMARSRIERQGKIAAEDLPENSESLSRQLLGGQLIFQKDSLALSASDGRILPVAILSSGQQELLPLWLMLNFWGPVRNVLIYIEEPEAHLFPSSQSIVTEYLIKHLNADGAANRSLRNNRMVITTHSPYILAKINNLIKAGALAIGASDANVSAINNVVKKEYWLEPGSTHAYGICDGKTKKLNDYDGLIDSEYLDGISGAIVQEFSLLQDIEFEKMQ